MHCKSKSWYRGSMIIGICLMLKASVCFSQKSAGKLDRSGDTLTISNDRIARSFLWNNGGLSTLALTSKLTGDCWQTQGQQADFLVPNDSSLPVSATYDTATVKATLQIPAHFRWQVVTNYGSFSLKRIYRLFSHVSMIRTDYYLKGALPFSNKRSATTTTGVEDNGATKTSEPVLYDHIALPGNHWKIKAIRFQDATDQHNTLVQCDEYTLYRSELPLRGNLLLAYDPLKDAQLLWLKESPIEQNQLAYPGQDFMVDHNRWGVSGPGIENKGSSSEWKRLYTTALGVAGGSEQEGLSTLRAYLKAEHPHHPPQDDMVMMNTWGDRGQDGKINEAFVLEELSAAQRLGVTHFQIDDGWQAGLSKNSASSDGKLWDTWPKESWQPHPKRFPNGLDPLVAKASELGIQLGLWFHPSNAHDYQQWQQDAEVVLNMHHQYGINYYKIDGIEIPTQQAQQNLRSFFDTIRHVSQGKVVFNLDATAGRRGGYFFLNDYGNIFLENRYTDWGNYYPHWTLRNLWMLSRYVPPENLQIEFLNKWRNPDKYAKDDPFAPGSLPFDYLFAITMMAQPLAWFEGSRLPEEAFAIAPMIERYKSVMDQLHQGVILPIGEEPSGRHWTGFQSISDEESGFILVFREASPERSSTVETWLPSDHLVEFTHVLGHGSDFRTTTQSSGQLTVQLPDPFTFALYRYAIGKKRKLTESKPHESD